MYRLKGNGGAGMAITATRLAIAGETSVNPVSIILSLVVGRLDQV